MRHLPIPGVVLALGLLAVYAVGVIVATQLSGATMAAAADRFLASLSAAQQRKATFPFDSEERLRWHFIPNEMFPRQGLPLKEMTEEQRALAKRLLQTGLSRLGYMTATEVMELERVLKALENGDRFARDPEVYMFSVFGTPATNGAWGWRVEGHHLSLHFTVVNGVAVASSPAFMGANPAEVREGPQKGLRVLGAEEDAARTVLGALDASQRAAAVIATVAPGDIVTGNALHVDPLSPAGVRASVLSPSQRDLLMRLIEVYTSMMAENLAADRVSKLRNAGFDSVTFAWAGEIERGRKHYYRVQGPTFLIEYDNTQNDANHVHSVWRDFDGDFGRDLLRDHIRAVPH